MITLSQRALRLALRQLSDAVQQRPLLPVLGNIRIISNHDSENITIASTDLSIGIAVTIAAQVHDDMDITVPFQLINGIVQYLPNVSLTLKWNQDTASLDLTCAGTETTIQGFPSDDFPSLPYLTFDHAVSIMPQPLLRKALQRVVSCASTATAVNPAIRGVYFRFSDTTATFAALDGYRLAQDTVDVQSIQPTVFILARQDVEKLIPLLSELPSDIVTIKTTLAGNHIQFCLENLVLNARVIEGHYPKYERFLPQTSNFTETYVGIESLANALKQAQTFATANGDSVHLDFDYDGDDRPILTIHSKASEFGQTKITSVITEQRGEPCSICLNIRYLLDALAALQQGKHSDLVELRTISPTQGFTLHHEHDNFVIMILPMMEH